MVTSHDVARVAGVSQATVSRVLRGSAHVRADTRERVLAALAQVGYTPNAHARAMRTGRTGTIGIVMERITNPFYPELLEALATVIAARGMRMILWLSEGVAEESAVSAIHERTIDGIIFTTVRRGSAALVEAIRVGAPFVLVNRTVPELPCDQVASDNDRGAADVAHYFAGSARRRVALVGGLPGTSTHDERSAGFIAAARSCGLELPERSVVTGDFSHADGAAAFTRLMAQGPPPDAVFCVNDILAFGVIDSARSMGVRVPDDLWVVGFDDIDMASWPTYSLTTVKQRLADMSNAAVDLLVQRLGSRRTAPVSLRFPSRMVVRRSTADREPVGVAVPGLTAGR